MNEVGLGKSIQRARQSAGLTQQQLCQRAELSYSTLAKIERGAIKSPSIFTIQRIATAIGISLNELLGINEKGDPSKKTSKNGTKFIYFDVNGCLVRFYHKAFTKIAADTGIDPEKVEMAFWHYNDSVCRGEISIDQFNQELARKLSITSINWQEYYLNSVESMDGMNELVGWAAEHYSVGLMSNIMPGLINALLDRGLIPKVNYTAIIDSSQVGAVKPESRIYEVAQEKSGVAPQEILLVDDSRANLMAAEKFGWHVLWFDDFEPGDSVARIKQALEFPVESPSLPPQVENQVIISPATYV